MQFYFKLHADRGDCLRLEVFIKILNFKTQKYNNVVEIGQKIVFAHYFDSEFGFHKMRSNRSESFSILCLT